MGPIDFIESEDIRHYLREIGYEPAPIEAAFLIWQGRLKTVSEKHAAWNELMHATSDVPIPARHGWNDGWESLHGMLREYMRIEDELIERFKEPSAECVYHARSSSFFGAAGLANDFEACLELALEKAKDPHAKASMINASSGHILIKKLPVTQNGSKACPEAKAWFNSQGELMRVDGRVGVEREEVFCFSFPAMWFNIPLPFERGDLVRNCETGCAFVLEGTTASWRRDNSIDTDYPDATDMEAYGATVGVINDLIAGHWGEPYRANCLQIEYFAGGLSEREKILPVYAAYLKRGIQLGRFLEYAQMLKRKPEADACEELLYFIEGYVDESAKKSQAKRLELSREG